MRRTATGTPRRRGGFALWSALAALVCVVPLWSSGGGAASAATAAERSARPSMTFAAHHRSAAAVAAVPPGGTFTYTLTAKNNGPSVARNVIAKDTLPNGIEFVSSVDGCTASGRTVTCGPEPQLSVGQTKSWTILVRLSASYQGDGSDLGNTVTGSSDATDPTPGNNQNPTPVKPPGSFEPVSDLSTVKEALGTGPTVPGQEYEYRITTSNAGPSDARNVKATDTLPAGLTYVSSADPCTASGGRTVTCGPRARLAPGASVSWTFRVKLSAAYTGDGTDLRNTAASTSDSRDPNPSDNTSPPVSPPGGVSEPQADLWTAKATTTSTPVAPGENFSYAVTVTNDGPSRAVNVKATDALPSQLRFVSSADGCTAGGTGGGATVSCGPQAVLEPGASKTWTFTVQLDPNYRGDGSDIRNTATSSSDTKDPSPNNNTSPPVGPPGSAVNRPNADLSVTKQAVGTTQPVPGTTFDYRITVKNNGPSADAYNVTLTDDLPQGLSYVASTPDGCTVSGRAVSCKRATPLKVGETTEYILTVKVDPAYAGDGSDMKNTARVTADNIDPNSDNDSNTAVPPGGGIAPPAADLGIVKKTVTDTPVAPGETFEYAVTVTNNGPSQAQQVRVTDALPAALSFVSSDDPCVSGRTVVCGPLDTLAPGASVSYVFKVKLAADYTGDGSDIGNRASVTSPTADPNSGNNTSAVTGPPGGRVKTPTADLEVTKETP
ncbi:DUF11 domain-containing protein [Streptomyces paludis]|uniref:DUF11 domain-containing protein n=1 Tax=Streptomyces paludis TaxID=2282738 RepID=A0A345HQX8_9ACTN|nr:DUF11 domain-containing protein [Streptomyces paludis]AXG79102.1 DUF11 domain-containing protein [Streptomyces paludis]